MGGLFGTVATLCGLPVALGVPVAVGAATLGAHRVGLQRATVAAAFTALFLQLVSFGEPLETFGYRLEAVGIAGLSAFIVNVAASSLFYEALFRKRLVRLSAHIDELLLHASETGPAVLEVVFPVLRELSHQLHQAIREMEWRRNARGEKVLEAMAARVEWLEDLVHLVVNLQYSLDSSDPDLRTFLAWLPTQKGQAPELPAPAAQGRERILALLEAPCVDPVAAAMQ